MCANRGRTKKGNISNEYSDNIRKVLHGDMVVCFIFFNFCLFIWLHWVLVVACAIFSFVMQILSCSLWDLVPWPGIEPQLPAMRAKSIRHWTTREVPVCFFFFFLYLNLYAGQEATVRTGHGTTDWFQIGKGVRQGCILSPCLFNLYAE